GHAGQIGQLATRHEAHDRDQQRNQHPEAEPEMPEAQLRQNHRLQRGTGLPITSTPAGGSNCTSSGSTAALRCTPLNSSVERWPSLLTATRRESSRPRKPNRASWKSDSAFFGRTRTHSSPSRRPSATTSKASRRAALPASSMA